jgi:hypothetical protein
MLGYSHNRKSRKGQKMKNEKIELEIGKEYRLQEWSHFSVGIVDKVTPKWVHIQGTYRTANKWILREKILGAYVMGKGKAVIISQMYDH